METCMQGGQPAVTRGGALDFKHLVGRDTGARIPDSRTDPDCPMPKFLIEDGRDPVHLLQSAAGHGPAVDAVFLRLGAVFETRGRVDGAFELHCVVDHHAGHLVTDDRPVIDGPFVLLGRVPSVDIHCAEFEVHAGGDAIAERRAVRQPVQGVEMRVDKAG